jgi:hypothetical protein
LECDVIQKYALQGKIPPETYIIIDEIGMCDKKSHDLLHVLRQYGKSIEAFGDYNQLPPPDCNEDEGKKYNSLHYNKFLFNSIQNTFIENHRNNFPQEYYDRIINGEIDPAKVVRKYSTQHPTDAEVIICWRNKTAYKYNMLMLEHLGLGPEDIGVKYICLSKNLNKRAMNDLELYNRKPIVIEDILYEGNKKWLYLSDGNYMRPIEFHKYFQLGYAVTVYGIQGHTVNSYYWPYDDKQYNENKFLSSEIAYTIVSRLRGNVYKPKNIVV